MSIQRGQGWKNTENQLFLMTCFTHAKFLLQFQQEVKMGALPDLAWLMLPPKLTSENTVCVREYALNIFYKENR